MQCPRYVCLVDLDDHAQWPLIFRNESVNRIKEHRRDFGFWVLVDIVRHNLTILRSAILEYKRESIH